MFGEQILNGVSAHGFTMDRGEEQMRVSTLNDGPFSTVSDGAWLVGVEPGIGGRGAVNHSPPRGEKG